MRERILARRGEPRAARKRPPRSNLTSIVHACLLVATLIAARAHAAVAPPVPGINWVRLEGAEQCLSAPVLAQRVGDHVRALRFGACATGACLIYQLFSENPTKQDIAQRRYCSCRCDAPQGDPGDLCTCKPGCSCVPTLTEGPPGVRGSYCVKNGTVLPE